MINVLVGCRIKTNTCMHTTTTSQSAEVQLTGTQKCTTTGQENKNLPISLWYCFTTQCRSNLVSTVERKRTDCACKRTTSSVLSKDVSVARMCLALKNKMEKKISRNKSQRSNRPSQAVTIHWKVRIMNGVVQLWAVKSPQRTTESFQFATDNFFFNFPWKHNSKRFREKHQPTKLKHLTLLPSWAVTAIAILCSLVALPRALFTDSLTPALRSQPTTVKLLSVIKRLLDVLFSSKKSRSF